MKNSKIMRKRKNHLWKIGILLLGLLLTFTNCEKEQIFDNSENPTNIENEKIIEPVNQQQGLKLSIIDYDKLKENHKVIRKLEKFNNNKSNLQAKEIYNQTYGFTINTDKVKYIENGDNHSYTFQIKRNNKSSETVENLVLKLNEQNSYDAILIDYGVTIEQFKSISKKELEAVKRTYTLLDIDTSELLNDINYAAKDLALCYEEWTYEPCSLSGGHGDGSLCNGGWILTSSGCTFGAGGFDSGSSGGSNPSDSPSTGGGSSSPTYSSPNYSIYEPADDYKFNKLRAELSLNHSQFNWLYSKYYTAMDVYDFLEDNAWSVETVNFAKNYIKLSILDIDNLTNEEIESFFNFNQDYKNRMSVSERIIFNNMSKIKQMSYLFNAQKATWRAENLYPNSLRNGIGDAFRHAYFNGLNANVLGVTLTESLATAHENKPLEYLYETKEIDMDLYNNQIGRNRHNWFQEGFNSLEESIIEAIGYGQLRYLSNLEGGGSSGKATNLSQLTISSN